MAYEPKPGDVSVFKNDRKEKDTQPDYRITGVGLDGAKIKGALWLKKDRNGNTFMSGKIEPDTYEKPDDFRGSDAGGVAGGDRHGRGQDAGRAAAYDLTDDVPF